MAAVSIAVLSFLGFDAIASFAEETTGDTRQVGRAIGVCLAVAGAAFVAQTALASLISPIAPGTLAATPSRQGTAFYDIVRAAIGGWLATDPGADQGDRAGVCGDDRAGGGGAAALRHGPRRAAAARARPRRADGAACRRPRWRRPAR